MSEMCGMRLAENAGPKKVAKTRHLGNIAQFVGLYLHILGFVSLGPFHCGRFIFVLCIAVCCMHNCLGL